VAKNLNIWCKQRLCCFGNDSMLSCVSATGGKSCRFESPMHEYLGTKILLTIEVICEHKMGF
jgi:hypothetical protein